MVVSFRFFLTLNPDDGSKPTPTMETHVPPEGDGKSLYHDCSSTCGHPGQSEACDISALIVFKLLIHILFEHWSYSVSWFYNSNPKMPFLKNAPLHQMEKSRCQKYHMTYWKDWDLGCYFNFGFVGNAWLCKLRLKYAATGGSSFG